MAPQTWGFTWTWNLALPSLLCPQWMALPAPTTSGRGAGDVSSHADLRAGRYASPEEQSHRSYGWLSWIRETIANTEVARASALVFCSFGFYSKAHAEHIHLPQPDS